MPTRPAHGLLGVYRGWKVKKTTGLPHIPAYFFWLLAAYVMGSTPVLAVPCAATDSVVVVSLTLEGNKITKDRIILRELDFKAGTRLACKSLNAFFEKELNKVRNTNLFIEERLTYEQVNPGEIAVKLSVKERWYTFPIPVVGLGDRSLNEWWFNQKRDLSRLEYGFKFKRRNFRGRKEDINLVTQFGFTKRLALIYRVPFIDQAQRYGLQFRINLDENDNIAYNTLNNRLMNVQGEQEILRRRAIASMALTRRDGFYHFHQLEFRFNNTWVADTVLTLNPRYFFGDTNRQRFFQLSYSFIRDLRDVAYYPLKGEYLFFEINRMGLLPTDQVNLTDFWFNYSLFRQLGKRFYWASNLSGRVSLPGDQPYTLIRGVGYKPNIIRGYDLYVIDGPHFGVWKNTLRWRALDFTLNWGFIPINQFSTIPIKVYFKAFNDLARIGYPNVQDFNRRLTNANLAGAGVGFDIVSFYNSVFSLEYSANRHREARFYISISSDI